MKINTDAAAKDRNLQLSGRLCDRFLSHASTRGDLLLAVAAVLSGPGMEGKAELFTLQLPVHAGEAVSVQHSPFLEKWCSCRFAAGSEQPLAFHLAWDDSGGLLQACLLHLTRYATVWTPEFLTLWIPAATMTQRCCCRAARHNALMSHASVVLQQELRCSLGDAACMTSHSMCCRCVAGRRSLQCGPVFGAPVSIGPTHMQTGR